MWKFSIRDYPMMNPERGPQPFVNPTESSCHPITVIHFPIIGPTLLNVSVQLWLADHVVQLAFDHPPFLFRQGQTGLSHHRPQKEHFPLSFWNFQPLNHACFKLKEFILYIKVNVAVFQWKYTVALTCRWRLNGRIYFRSNVKLLSPFFQGLEPTPN